MWGSKDERLYSGARCRVSSANQQPSHKEIARESKGLCCLLSAVYVQSFCARICVLQSTATPCPRAAPRSH